MKTLANVDNGFVPVSTRCQQLKPTKPYKVKQQNEV